MNSINTKTTQKLTQEQRPILTQELQLFLKLIQMTTLELKEYLEDQLVENPVLEVAEERNKESGVSSDLPESETQSNPSEMQANNGENSEEEFDFKQIEDSPFRDSQEGFSFGEFSEEYEEETPWENRVSSNESLLDHLDWQLSLSDFSPEERAIASVIIGNINEDGYLEVEPKEIAIQVLENKFKLDPDSVIKDKPEEERKLLYENLVKSDGSYVDMVEKVLGKIQHTFDPTGVGARDLKECLKIQAEDLGFKNDKAIMRIIESHLEDVSNKDYKKIADALGTSLEEVENAASIISSFEPRPGRPFYQQDTEKYIMPDFYVYKVGNDLQIQLNRDFPRIRINQYYRNLFKQGRELPRDAKKYIREKLEAAQRIIKCLEERDATIRKVVSEIVKVQRDFFEYGNSYIRPLKLKDIAQTVNVHESTVSRITSRRYIQTPQGTIELKSLFSRKIETSHGKELSFEKVKTIIKEIIANEPPESPYSDEDISKILERRNIKVARRTVAKYRKILNIPPSSERIAQNGK